MLEPLQAIRDITAACSLAGVDHWLFGGWAIDFHLGYVTRNHYDIDLIIWSRDKANLTEALQQHGFILTETIPEHIYFEKYHQRIEVSVIEQTTSGAIITPGRWANWTWSPDAFSAGERTLLGVRCPVTSLESVIESKRDFQAHAPDKPLRDKDKLDLAQVEEFLNRNPVRL